MAKRFDIAQLRRDFKEFEEIAKRDISNVVQSSADIIVANAKKRAPANLGKLRQSIGKEEKKEGLEATIFVGERYGVYLEFGTKTFVSVPPELQTLALQFKGNGVGDMDSFLQSILDWVKQKNIGGTYSIRTRKVTSSQASRDNQSIAAWFIAMSILKKGIKPQPFLWPSFIEERPKIPTKIDKILQRSAKAFSDK